MGRHDDYAHVKHVTKQLKFKSPKPQDTYANQRIAAPQTPATRTNANNRYLNGRGW